jgi:hypothetical protein
MVEFVFYTAILNSYDQLPNFVHWDDNVRYICFTNGPLDAGNSKWELVYIPSYFKDPKITSGFFKANSHILFGADVISLWVDGNLRNINVTAASAVKMVAHSPVAALPLRERTKVSEEIDVVVSLGLEHPSSAGRLRQMFRTDGFPDDQPLAATMMLVRDHRSAALRRANGAWWSLISSGIRRDQLTFNFALWRSGITQAYIDVDWRAPNYYFTRIAHGDSRGRVIGDGGGLPAKYAGHYFETPAYLDEYRRQDVGYFQENWTEDELAVLRRVNTVVRTTTHDGVVEGNYCHFHAERVCAFTPPDPRRSWKREYLRRAVRGCRNAIEIGFNAGHSAIIMLEAEPFLRLTSVDVCDHSYTPPCSATLRDFYCDRFAFLAGRSEAVLNGIDMEVVDFVHVDGGHDPASVEFVLHWFCEKAKAGCYLMVDDAFVGVIDAGLEEMTASGRLERAYCNFPSSGENLLFRKI